MSTTSIKEAASCASGLAMDMVQRANSGHPGAAMGMSLLGAVLFSKHLIHTPRNPQWMVRDRLVLSNGHASAWLYAWLHLLGYISIDDLKAFRQKDSLTPGHPEFGKTPGVDASTGPLGQGFANAVGMALSGQMMEARYGALFGCKVWCVCGDGCMMEGVCQEAASIAGHYKPKNLIALYDDNGITIDGGTSLTFSDDVAARFVAYGWRVIRADGRDADDLERALAAAEAGAEGPTLVIVKTVIGEGSPAKAGTSACHGAPLGAAEVRAAKGCLGLNPDLDFQVPEGVAEMFAARVRDLDAQYDNWYERFEAWKAANPDLAEELAEQFETHEPWALFSQILDAMPSDGKPISTRKLGQFALRAIEKLCPALVGGCGDLGCSTLATFKDSKAISAGDFSGRTIHFGVREFAMMAIANGIAYSGAFRPYVSTFFVFVDYLLPALRVAAIAKLPVVFIGSHDSVYVGEDGATHHPVEQAAHARAIPGVRVYRPCNPVEVAYAYCAAFDRNDGPSVILLSRQDVSLVGDGTVSEDLHRGGYVIYGVPLGSVEPPSLVIVATGSEVSVAVEVAKTLEKDGLSVRVVSLPCQEIYLAQSQEYREALVPREAMRVSLEAGITTGWERIVGSSAFDGALLLGVDDFGFSAPAKVVAAAFGITAPEVERRIREEFGI